MPRHSLPASLSPTRRQLFKGVALAGGSLAAWSLAEGSAEAATTYTGAKTTGQYSIVTGPNLSAVPKMGLVVLLPHEYPKIASIKAASPGAKVLVYKNVGAVSRAGTGAYQPNVVTYQQVLANPGWALHDNTGATIYWTDFGGYLQPIDPGDPGVIAASGQAIIDECKAHGFDGVFLDDLNSDWTHYNTGASYPVDFTGGNAYASTKAWVSSVVPRLRNSGLEVVGNAQINLTGNWQEVLTAWSTYLNGVCLEHFSRWGDYSSAQWPNFTGWMWDQRVMHAATIQKNGAYLMGISYGDAGDTLGQRYHRAMFLMLSDGGGYSFWCPSGLQGSFDAPQALTDLGAPTSGATKLSNGLWKRTFQRGFVILNPTASSQGGTAAWAGLGSDTTWVNLASGDAIIRSW